MKPGAVSISSVDKNENVIVVLGNEGSGIRTNVLNRCDSIVYLSSTGRSSSVVAETSSLPVEDSNGNELVDDMVGSNNDRGNDYDDDNNDDEDAVDSLNVSVAGGIILHHFLGTD